ncbi:MULTISPECIES: hypothetical protein [unclassified Nocardioides]|uniref:hypothetical protein n=1 Tax=unclassified Nocardioides TaxID=2615069 RepID=UPI000B0CA108|nr:MULTISPECIES: hypothetical protein [unclassified Nocardioides]
MAGLSLALVVGVLVFWLRQDDDAETPRVLDSPSARQDLAAAALADLQTAVGARDRARLHPDAGELAETAVDNAEELRVAGFTARYVDEDAALTATLPDGQWAAAVDTTWRFAGYDPREAHAEVTFVFAREGDHAVLVDVGGGGRRTPLWLATALNVSRTPQALVMAAGDQPVNRFARQARVAVRAVGKVLPPWRQKLVMVVPESDEQLDEVLAADPGEYAEIAAVTTTVDGSLSPSAPVHVFVNPEVFSGLRRNGAQVVTTHELVHVATGAATASNTPLWLLEGFADYVALRDVTLPLSVTAGQVLAQVRRDGAPRHLPAGNEFDTHTTHLGASYEAAWLACRLLAQTGSEQDLLRLYDEVSDGAPVGAALQQVYGFGEKELVQRWRRELERLAR